MRVVGGKPLIGYTLDALAAASEKVPLLTVVSSDDEQILGWCRLRGVETHLRPHHLAEDHVPVASVADAVAEQFEWTGPVAILQPTSPLRGPDSIVGAIQTFLSSDLDSLATVSREHHLYWYAEDGKTEHATPLYRERVNRQLARHGLFRETGAIQIMSRDVLRQDTTVGPRHGLIEMEPAEAVDVDTLSELEAVRQVIERACVYFRVAANRTIGSGHLFRCLELAAHLSSHDVRFVLENADEFAHHAVATSPFTAMPSEEFWTLVAQGHVAQKSVTINDVLDTSAQEVLALRNAGHLVVNLEDLGPGASHANLVINSLYPTPTDASLEQRVLFGPNFHVLRSEFVGLPPKQIRAEANRVLITFGGTDPARLAVKSASAVRNALPDASLHVILGPGYDGPVDTIDSKAQVQRSVRNMAEAMSSADVVVTSAGRTVYEAAATGTPIIVMAQNEREATHSHISAADGVIYLGLGAEVSDTTIGDAVKALLEDVSRRRALAETLRESSDAKGAERIAYQIEGLLRGLTQ
jgi:spore coat polysaccharide biosynthesis predicted glycosyltransferase SpsG/CMP-N-acetylneuraminic acid synthetase